MDQTDSFNEFAAAHRGALLRLGWALTGDRGHGEDLVQITLSTTLENQANATRRYGLVFKRCRHLASALASLGRNRYGGCLAIRTTGDGVGLGDVVATPLAR